MLYGDYMVTNELIESQWPRHQLNNSLTYMLEKTNINPTKKIKIGTFENDVQIGWFKSS
jgi:hypothetical protein